MAKPITPEEAKELMLGTYRAHFCSLEQTDCEELRVTELLNVIRYDALYEWHDTDHKLVDEVVEMIHNGVIMIRTNPDVVKAWMKKAEAR